MLHNVLIISSSSGLVLFSTEFFPGSVQPRLTGPLITTIANKAKQVASMGVSYIEMTEASVTIIEDEEANLYCTVFHDPGDGWEFGRLVAHSVLTAFVNAHANELGRLGHNLRDMTTFAGQIADAVRRAIHPVLYKLQLHKGVTYALLIVNDSIIPAVPGSAAELDRLGVLANIGAFEAAARETMALMGDAPRRVTLESGQRKSTIVQRLDAAVLVVCCSNVSHPRHLMHAVDKAATLLDKVCTVINGLRGRLISPRRGSMLR